MQNGRTLAIVGGGFSGTTLAIQLLRRQSDAPLRVVVIEPRAELGAGVAYAARDYPYPLNVAAGQMSLDAANPQDFLDYLHAESIQAGAADYLPRQVYGEYLRSRLAAARAAAPEHLGCEHRRARALQVRRAVPGPWQLWLDDGGILVADQVVLALGNPPPACPDALRALSGSSAVIQDPWSIGAHGNFESVLLLGSGLTMIDAALRLAAIRPRLRHIHVLSRHGLLPQPQAGASPQATPTNIATRLAEHSGSVLGLFRALRGAARDHIAAGGDWREVLTQLRPRLPVIWRSLDERERRRFLRHLRSWWEVFRHRVPTGPLMAVRNLERQGVLETHAGRVLELNDVQGCVEVIWRPRGARRTRTWLVDRVVNCTGPDHRVAESTDPLVRSLLATGLIRADALGLGVDVAPDYRVLGAAGLPVNGLHYLGPWLRARDWEATAVPELRAHAAALARHLVDGNLGNADRLLSDLLPRPLP
jgi:uncharacterized NAD(P)/FAD-binding protein YdhS